MSTEKEAIDLQELIELRNNLRWRRSDTHIPALKEKVIFMGPTGDYMLGDGVDIRASSFYVQWLPFSALPKPEGGK